MTDNERTWHADFLQPAVGRTITSIRTLTEEEVLDMGWDHVWDYGQTVVITFDDESIWIPMQDPEGNGPGFIEFVEAE